MWKIIAIMMEGSFKSALAACIDCYVDDLTTGEGGGPPADRRASQHIMWT